MNDLCGAYVRRQEMVCTEADLITYGDKVLLDGEVIYVRMNDGSIKQKMGNGTMPVFDLPFTDFGIEKVDAAAQKALTEIVDAKVKMLGEIAIAGNIVQTPGESETVVMSQKAITDAVNGISEDLDAEIANRETAILANAHEVRKEINSEMLRAKKAERELEEKFTAPTQEAVNQWLENNPEATTTVVDESLTDAKFTQKLKQQTIKDYVTPQMYGAVGDGVTDDTDALQDAIDSGIAVRIPKGEYLVTRKIFTQPNTDIRGFGNTSVIKCESEMDLFMVAYATKISNLKIVLDNPDVVMDGAIFKMNEESLATSEPVHAANVRSFISNILIEINGAVVTSGHLACFETSLKSNWGLSGTRKGFYGFNVNNVTAMCITTAKVGYFYRSYAAKDNWITSVQFSNCGMIGQRWCFFMGYTDEEMFNETYRGDCCLTAYNVFHQKTDTNCEGFLFQRAGTRVSLYGCEPWDWKVRGPESTRYPYVIDKALVTATASYWLDNPSGMIKQYKLVEKVNNEYVYTPLTDSDYTTYYAFLKVPFSAKFFRRAQCLSDGNSKIALIASVKMPTLAFRTITFEHHYKTQRINCCVWLQQDGTVSINLNDELNHRFSFYYTIVDGVFNLYHVSTTVFDAQVSVVKTDSVTNSIEHFSGKGAPYSDYCFTVNALDITDDVYLDELPEGAILLTPVIPSKPHIITSPNGSRFEVTVSDDGTLSAKPC